MEGFSVDVQFVFAIVRDQDYRRFLSSRIGVKNLRDPNALAGYKFIEDFLMGHGKLPSVDLLSEHSGIKMPTLPEAPIQYYEDELMKRELHGMLHDGLGGIAECMSSKNPVQALNKIEELLTSVRNNYKDRSQAKSIFDINDEVIKFYERVKKKELGLTAPWPSMTDSLMGLHPGDLILFVARLKVGKTWMLLYLAFYIWHTHKVRVLFISAEMSEVSLAMRFHAMRLKMGYGRMRRARLSLEEEKEFFVEMTRSRGYEGFFIVGDEFDLSLPQVKATIYDTKPAIVFADGAYLFKVPGIKNRMDKAPIIADELKSTAKNEKIPIVASMQFNRSASDKKDNDLDSSMVSLSDAFGWNCDALFALMRSKDMIESKEMKVKTLAVREGEPFDMVLNWDFDRMDFSEKISDTRGSFVDAGFKGQPTWYDPQEKDDFVESEVPF